MSSSAITPSNEFFSIHYDGNAKEAFGKGDLAGEELYVGVILDARDVFDDIAPGSSDKFTTIDVANSFKPVPMDNLQEVVAYMAQQELVIKELQCEIRDFKREAKKNEAKMSELEQDVKNMKEFMEVKNANFKAAMLAIIQSL